jgi:hypothetical protein
MNRARSIIRRATGRLGREALATPEPKAKRNKFGAKLAGCQNGHQHHSRAEAYRCNNLHMLERGGVIRSLVQQPQFWFSVNGRQVKHENGRRVGYKADFAYEEADGQGGWRSVVEDVKGPYRDDAWTLRKAMFRALFPSVDLREVA